jgi:SAM-dependent methyltransferase
MPNDHVAINRTNWNADAPNWVQRGRRSWSADEPFWGTWGSPESEVGLLPDVDGLDAVELGCGTAYVSAWLARKGARAVAMDVSEEQLATARTFQEEFDLHFPLLQADGERLPFADATFDVAISEYGVALWCDPYRWIPEAARVLRSGGRLVFLTVASFMMLCFPRDDDSAPADTTLHRDYFGMHRFEWPDDDSVEFHLPHGEWIRLLRRNGLTVEDLIEIQAPEGASTRFDFLTVEWARRWPSEEIWKARKEA